MPTPPTGEIRAAAAPHPNSPPAAAAVSAAAGSRPPLSARLVHAITRPAIRAILWIGALTHLALLAFGLPRRANQFDFSVFYASAVAMRRGFDPYTHDLRAIGAEFHLQIYPLIHTTSTPTFLMLFAPFAMLPPIVAYWTWMALSAAALALAIVLMLRDSTSTLDRAQAQALGAMMLLYAPIADHIAYAQAQFLVLALIVLMLRALARGHDGRAGFAFALAAALRAFPFVLAAYLLLKRRWRALFSAALGLAAIELLTLAVVGWPLIANFIRFVVRAPVNVRDLPIDKPIDVALFPFITRIFWYAFGHALGPRLDRIRGLTVALAQLGVVGLAVRATLRAPAREDPDLRALSLWIVVTLLISPVTWIHYLVLLLIPFHRIAAATAAGRCPPGAMWFVVGSYFVLSFAISLRNPARAVGGRTLFLAVGEGAFVALALAFVATWRFATAGPATVSSSPRAPAVRARNPGSA